MGSRSELFEELIRHSRICEKSRRAQRPPELDAPCRCSFRTEVSLPLGPHRVMFPLLCTKFLLILSRCIVQNDGRGI